MVIPITAPTVMGMFSNKDETLAVDLSLFFWVLHPTALAKWASK